MRKPRRSRHTGHSATCAVSADTLRRGGTLGSRVAAAGIRSHVRLAGLAQEPRGDQGVKGGLARGEVGAPQACGLTQSEPHPGHLEELAPAPGGQAVKTINAVDIGRVTHLHDDAFRGEKPVCRAEQHPCRLRCVISPTSKAAGGGLRWGPPVSSRNIWCLPGNFRRWARARHAVREFESCPTTYPHCGHMVSGSFLERGIQL